MRLFAQRPAASGFAVILGLATGCALALGPIAGTVPATADAMTPISATYQERGSKRAELSARPAARPSSGAGHCDELQSYLDAGTPFIEARKKFVTATPAELVELQQAAQLLAEAAPAPLRRPWRAMAAYLEDKAAGKASAHDFLTLAETLNQYDGSIERDAQMSCGIDWPA